MSPVTLGESRSLNENFQVWYAQSQPWLTLRFHFHSKVPIYIYQAFTMSAQWGWLVLRIIHFFTHSFTGISRALTMGQAMGWGMGT